MNENETEQNDKFERQLKEAYQSGNAEHYARVLSGRLRQMDKRAREANRRADWAESQVKGLTMNREGFWISKTHPDLPKPQSDPEIPWSGRDRFLEELDKRESNLRALGRVVRYRGFSGCRMCSKINGSEEFVQAGWTWPQGFRHYIADHNVRPSLAFQEFIEGREL